MPRSLANSITSAAIVLLAFTGCQEKEELPQEGVCYHTAIGAALTITDAVRSDSKESLTEVTLVNLTINNRPFGLDSKYGEMATNVNPGTSTKHFQGADKDETVNCWCRTA